MMKNILTCIVALSALLFTSCEDEENLYFISVDPLGAQCTDNGVWNACFTNTTGFDIEGIHFSHTSHAWDHTWYGFCPSKVRDLKEYTPAEWPDHLWASTAGHSARGDYDATYLVAYADASTDGETYSSPCIITGVGGITFKPYDVYISNTTYGRYAMENGTASSRPFEPDDWYVITITGYRNEMVTGSIDVYLAQRGRVIKEWQRVRLSKLGLIDHLIFTPKTSIQEKAEGWLPPYFCIDALHMH